MPILDLSKRMDKALIDSEPEFFSNQIEFARRFYQNLDLETDEGFVVCAGGLELCKPSYTVSRDSFPYLTIEYISCGEGELLLGDLLYPLKRGSFFFYGPGIKYTITGRGEKRLEKYFINFHGVEAEKLFIDQLNLPGTVLVRVNHHRLKESFEELIHYGLSHTSERKRICRSLTEALIYKIIDSGSQGYEEQGPSFDTYQRCRDYIAGNFLNLRGLEEVSAACGINSSYLCRLFKRFDHQSPYQYLQALQMRYGADLLLHSGTSVKKVAALMGYEDQFHFSRTFKRVLGISPHTFATVRWV